MRPIDGSQEDNPALFQLDIADLEVYNDMVLGQGSMGTVVKGKYKGNDVAVKLFDQSAGVQGALAELSKDCSNEVQFLSQLSHPNVLKLYGACLLPPPIEHYAMVNELCLCSIETLLYSKKPLGPNMPSIPLSLKDVLRMSIELMMGIEYLHSRDIIHRDLKSGNCLIDQNGVVKISDFGLARIKYQTQRSSKGGQGTIPYMAPECFNQSLGSVTVRSDIYSAGILIGEMINGQRPWGGMNYLTVMFQVVHDKKSPPLTEDAVQCPPSLRQLLLDCVSHEAEKRPTASSVLSRLREIQQEKTPEPDASSSAHQSSKFSDYFEGWKNLYIAEK